MATSLFLTYILKEIPQPSFPLSKISIHFNIVFVHLPVREALVSSPAITGRGSLAILSRTGLEETGMLTLVEVDFFTALRSGLSTLIANRMEPSPTKQK